MLSLWRCLLHTDRSAVPFFFAHRNLNSKIWPTCWQSRQCYLPKGLGLQRVELRLGPGPTSRKLPIDGDGTTVVIIDSSSCPPSWRFHRWYREHCGRLWRSGTLSSPQKCQPHRSHLLDQSKYWNGKNGPACWSQRHAKDSHISCCIWSYVPGFLRFTATLGSAAEILGGAWKVTFLYILPFWTKACANKKVMVKTTYYIHQKTNNIVISFLCLSKIWGRGKTNPRAWTLDHFLQSRSMETGGSLLKSFCEWHCALRAHHHDPWRTSSRGFLVPCIWRRCLEVYHFTR